MLKGWYALDTRMKTREKDAVGLVAIELQATKLNLERQCDALDAFKFEVAQKYVTGVFIARSEE